MDASAHTELSDLDRKLTGQFLVTPEQAATSLALGRTKVYELLRNGELESVCIGSSRRIPREALEEYVRTLRKNRTDRNPCTIRGAGIEHAPERPMLATTTVLQLAESIEPRLRCLILLGGFAGLRTGELLGLQRRDLDPLHGTVTVVRQSHEITGQGRITTAPKSDAGYRTVALPRFVLVALEEHLGQHVEGAPDAPVFTRPSGLPLRRADLSLAWRAPVTPWVCAVSVRMISVTTPLRSSPAIPTSRCEN
jgi:excisionase family DNA binding protein